MIRNIKAHGLALVAVFAMSAVVASGASAANFTASSYPAAGSGGQTTSHVFTVQGQNVTCKSASFTGSLSSASEQITITPSYSECTAFGFVNATVEMNECRHLVTIGTGTSGSVHIACPAGKSITINGGSCTVHISAQTPANASVTFHNSGGSVLITSGVGGISSNVTKGSFLCPLSNSASDTSGKYTGSTLFGSTEGKTIDVG